MVMINIAKIMRDIVENSILNAEAISWPVTGLSLTLLIGNTQLSKIYKLLNIQNPKVKQRKGAKARTLIQRLLSFSSNIGGC